MNAAFLSRHGWEVCVVTTTALHSTQGMDESLSFGIPEEVVVERVASPDAVLAEWFPKIGRAVSVLVGRYILPEAYLPWMFPATTRAMRVIDSWRPDVIYSRATKHVSNVVGWRLKKRTGLPWIAHFSDPWIRGGFRKSLLQRLIGGFWENRILRDADALVFVTQQAANSVMKGLPSEWRDRVHVIPHGFEDYSVALTESPVRKVSDSPGSRPLRLIHAGAFYPGLRGPESLIKALTLLKERRQIDGVIEVDCLGVDTVCYQPIVEAAGVGEVLRLYPAVSFERCQKRIHESDIILIIDTPGFDGVFLPTKLIEAFAFKKVVFGLAEAGSATASVLAEVDQPCANLNDPCAIAEALDTLLDRWVEGTLNPDPSQLAGFKGFQIDRVNQPLLDIFARLAGKKGASS